MTVTWVDEDDNGHQGTCACGWSGLWYRPGQAPDGNDDPADWTFLEATAEAVHHASTHDSEACK